MQGRSSTTYEAPIFLLSVIVRVEGALSIISLLER